MAEANASETAASPAFELPKVLSGWAKQFNDDYNEENAYFLEGVGTDQELFAEDEEYQRLYFVDLAIGNASEDKDQCFPEQIKGLFLNKRKNEWMSRFMGYGIMYLLLSGLSIVMSAFQYRQVKMNQLQGYAASKHISAMPALLLTSWTFQSLLFHLVMTCTMLFVDIASQICPIIALLGVSIAFYSISYRAAASQRKEVRQSDMLICILVLVFGMIIFGPRIMTKNQDCILVFGLLWLPQILTNFVSHPSWQFHYRFGFSFVQSCYYIFPPLYARGFHNNFYFLKPDPFLVHALLGLHLLQLVIMQV